MKIEKIMQHHKMIAMILYNDEIEYGVHFYTPNTRTLQVGKQRRLVGEKIKAHKHVLVKTQRREPLQEVLYIEKGKMRVIFYNDGGKVIENRILKKGDLILLISGGHGFEFLEETEMIEIKQGPYYPESRKDLDVKEKR